MIKNMARAQLSCLLPDTDLTNCDIYIMTDEISVSFIDKILDEAKTCTLITSSIQRAVILDFLCKNSAWREKGFRFFYDRVPLNYSICLYDVKDKRFCGHEIGGIVDWYTLTNIDQYPYTPLTYDELTKYIEKLTPIEENDIDSTAIFKDAVSVDIPLYIIDKETRTKKAPEASGVNWGCQSGNPRKEGPIEAYIPITKATISSNVFFIPSHSIECCETNTRKIRVDVLWDDGTVMQACFSGKGSVVNGLRYPKQLTSGDGGGAAMGGYFRRRLGVGNREAITYKEFSIYGRDYLSLKKMAKDLYYIDFSV